MEWLPLLVALLIVFLFPILDRGKVADLRDKPGEAERLMLYRHSLLALWLATAAALAVESGWQPMQVVPASPVPWIDAHRVWFDAAVALICAGFVGVLGQGLLCASSAARRRAVAPAFARLAYLLPASRHERRWWIVLSLSAGICEELLYRGYLLHFLDAQVGLGMAWLLSSLAFGFAHLYQGWRGIVSAAVTGLLLGLLAIGTGNLLLPIAVHILVDLQILWMYRPASAHGD